MISFTINSVEYEAEKGMTWAQWIESEYAPQNESYYFEGSPSPYCVLYYYNGGDSCTNVHINTNSTRAEYMSDYIVENNMYLLYTSQGPYGDGHNGGFNE